jgi:hypothetical protein
MCVWRTFHCFSFRLMAQRHANAGMREGKKRRHELHTPEGSLSLDEAVQEPAEGVDFNSWSNHFFT